MLHLEEKVKNQSYVVSLKSNGIIVGEFIKLDDLYYFSENKNRTWGLWSSEFLKSLANELENLNSNLNERIVEYLNYQ